MRQVLARLRFLPRAPLPDTTAPPPADALSLALAGGPRIVLTAAAAAFRGAFDAREPRAIDEACPRLLDPGERLGGRS